MQSGELRDELREALLDAFRVPGEMKIVVDRADLGVSFANFLAADGTTYEVALFHLLQWVDAQDKIVPLLNAAGRKNPGNPKLRDVRAKLADLESRFRELRPVGTFEEAERIVLKGVKFEDVGPWIDRLATMRRAVCRIEPQPESDTIAGYGTGFLVAPDIVMTNYHVATTFWTDKQRAERVRLRFDYESALPGEAASRDTEHKLTMSSHQSGDLAGESDKTPWQVAFSPKDPVGLDFALLRLTQPAGDDLVRGAKRGFLKLTSRRFSSTDPILILQHPAAEPLKLSFGAVEKPDPPSHVEYKVNTDGGSSGSPCLTQDLKVTAIHHMGLPAKNRGVTHEAILSYLKAAPDRLTPSDRALILG
jgi:Trypsin-like peptidase domain/Effector-associated domain 1